MFCSVLCYELDVGDAGLAVEADSPGGELTRHREAHIDHLVDQSANTLAPHREGGEREEEDDGVPHDVGPGLVITSDSTQPYNTE